MNQDVPAYPNKTVLKFLYTCCKQNVFLKNDNLMQPGL